jgi:hypothetical protein
MQGAASWFADAAVAQADRARAEAARFPTLRAWWAETERGDWMLWVAGRAGVDYRLVVAAAADCARFVLELVDDDTRPVGTAGVDAVEAWCGGRVSSADCRAAASRIHREAERTAPIEDARLAAGRAAALWALESLVQAAASDDRVRSVEFASECVRRVAGAHGRMHGPDEAEATHGRCAEAVRARIPSRSLPAT